MLRSSSSLLLRSSLRTARRPFAPLLASSFSCSSSSTTSSSSSCSTSDYEWPTANSGIEKAFTPPSSWYLQSEFYEKVEKEITFGGGNGGNSWCNLGSQVLSCLVKEGDYQAITVLNQPLLIVKAKGGVIKAFYNVCRHHAAQICDEGIGSIGENGRFTCPYHGWQYNADGRLTKAIQMKGCEGFTAKEFGLHSLPVAVVGPWIYVKLIKPPPTPPKQTTTATPTAAATSSYSTSTTSSSSSSSSTSSSCSANSSASSCSNSSSSSSSATITPTTPTSHDIFEDLPDLDKMLSLLEKTGYRNLQHYKSRSYVLKCNWKVFIDNYLDGGYHVPVAHRELASRLNLNSYTRQSFQTFHLQTCPAAPSSTVGGDTRLTGGSEGGGEGGDVAEGATSEAVYIYQYPNVCINRYGQWMDTNIVWPLTVDTCLVIFDWFIHPSLLKTKGIEEVEKAIIDSDRVQQEDIWLCERVQKGLQSRGYDVGRYAPALEGGEYLFHQKLYEDYKRSSLFLRAHR